MLDRRARNGAPSQFHHKLLRGAAFAPSTTYSTTAMFSLQGEAIRLLADQHPKPSDVQFQYGTAGFRTLYASHADPVDALLISEIEEIPWTLSCSELAFLLP